MIRLGPEALSFAVIRSGYQLSGKTGSRGTGNDEAPAFAWLRRGKRMARAGLALNDEAPAFTTQRRAAVE